MKSAGSHLSNLTQFVSFRRHRQIQRRRHRKGERQARNIFGPGSFRGDALSDGEDLEASLGLLVTTA